MKAGSLVKRIIAVGMMAVTAFMLPATPLHETAVKAAESRTGAYIKEMRLFIAKDGKGVADAESWCASQGKDWKVLKGDQDGDLNSGADGAFTKKVGVYLCYQTTTDPDEAITDLAVMNEKGKYSEGDYELLLKKQKEAYTDMVKNMKTMIEEYRENYKKNTPMAVKAHDFLNSYADDDNDPNTTDDTGELLGDILLKADDDRLVNILLQCNGIIVLTMQQKLAEACEKNNSTWLERMAKLGSYDKLKSAFSKNMTGGNIDKAMEQQYKDGATKILENWDDLSKRIADVSKFEKQNNLVGVSNEAMKTWVNKLDPLDKDYAYYQGALTLSGLGGYAYGDRTLFDYFSRTKAQVEKEGIETLYPMVACLSKGQISALSESVGLFQLVQDAYISTLYRSGDKGIMANLEKNGDKEVVDSVKEAIDGSEKIVEKLGQKIGEKKVSIYEGVDRSVFNGGVAVTTDAANASAGSEDKWTKKFVNNGNISYATYAIGGAALASAGLAVLFLRIAASDHVAYDYDNSFGLLYCNFVQDRQPSIQSGVIARWGDEGIRKETIEFIHDNKALYENADDFIEKATSKTASAAEKSAYYDLNKYAGKESWKTYYSHLELAFTVFSVILAATDIALTIYALYDYYNVDHLPIPHHMVDRTYSETKEASYVAYKSVRDQDGNCGDLNGGNARQWLALYYTKDRAAGNPLLAPTDKGNEMAVIVGSDKAPGTDYSPLHMFGTVNVPQNLTFADGDAGYSFNDKNGGTYMFFTHAKEIITFTDRNNNVITGDETLKSEESVSGSATGVEADQTVSGSAVSTDQTGTVISGGTLFLVGIGGIAIGGLCGFLIAGRRRKKITGD